MRFDVISIFPQVFEPFASVGVVGRAVKEGRVEIRAHDLRAFTHDAHRQVDDAPFGGGAGMVLKPEPVFEAVEAVRRENGGPVILFEPWGEPFTQGVARELAQAPGLILVCGRYEGIDDRVRAALADRELSVGDFVLSGGEIPALAVIDAVARLLPGVVGDPQSLEQDSFRHPQGHEQAGLLGYPQYTRPAEFRGLNVPEVLLSGDHAAIARWRREQSERRTRHRSENLKGVKS